MIRILQNTIIPNLVICLTILRFALFGRRGPPTIWSEQVSVNGIFCNNLFSILHASVGTRASKSKPPILAWKAFCNGGICPRGLIVGGLLSGWLLSGWLLSGGFLSRAFNRLPIHDITKIINNVLFYLLFFS